MALFKILRGSSAGLKDLPINDGWCYFTPDTGLFYIDYNGTRVPLNAEDAQTLSGASLVQALNSENLDKEILSAAAVDVIKENLELLIAAKQERITGTEGQVVVIGANGNPTVVNANLSTSGGIIDQNTGEIIKMWHGTVEEYDAIVEKDDNTIYILTDEIGSDIVANDIEYDNSVSGLLSTNVQNAIDEVYESISNIDHSAYSTATNLINGSSDGSLRSSGSEKETDSYALGKYSVALGTRTKASGGYGSFAVGMISYANGDSSQAEGTSCTANGHISHAEGFFTTANGQAQHVQGKGNIPDTTSAHIVGNGNVGSLSNAHTLDWEGNAWFAGDVYVGSTSGKNKDEGSKKLVTVDDIAQADWNQNDENASDYIKNRPFYDESISITFDGNIESKENIPQEGAPITMVKIHDTPINAEKFIGGYFEFIRNGSIYGYDITADSIQSMGTRELISEMIMIVHEAFDQGDGTIVSPGIWISVLHVDDNNFGYVSLLEASSIKTIDPQFVDYNPRNIKDMYYEEKYWIDEKVLIDNLSYNDWTPSNPIEFNLSDGAYYTVIWNGEEFNNVQCWAYDDYLILGGWGDEGYPFYINSDADRHFFAVGTEEESWESVTVIQNEQEVHNLKKIDSKYLPEMAPPYGEVEKEGYKVIVDNLSYSEYIFEPEIKISEPFSQDKIYDVILDGQLYEGLIPNNLDRLIIPGFSSGYETEFYNIGSGYNGELYIGVAHADAKQWSNITILERTNSEINYVDSKYIKDMYFVKDDGITVFIDNEEVEFAPDEYNENFYSSQYFIQGQFFNGNGNGQYPSKFIITWDGNEYALFPSNDRGSFYLGNINYRNGETGGYYPFYIMSGSEGEIWIITEDSSNFHTISIKRYDEEKVQTIPEKYLPEHLQFSKNLYSLNFDGIIDSIAKFSIDSNSNKLGYVGSPYKKVQLFEETNYTIRIGKNYYYAPFRREKNTGELGFGNFGLLNSQYDSPYEDTGETFCISYNDYGFKDMQIICNDLEETGFYRVRINGPAMAYNGGIRPEHIAAFPGSPLINDFCIAKTGSGSAASIPYYNSWTNIPDAYLIPNTGGWENPLEQTPGIYWQINKFYNDSKFIGKYGRLACIDNVWGMECFEIGDEPSDFKTYFSPMSAVKSVNGQFGDINIDIDTPIAEHNEDPQAHSDIREAIETAKTDVKNDLLNGAGEAYDTLKELGELIDDNKDAIDALREVATNKANKSDVYTKAEVDAAIAAAIEAAFANIAKAENTSF